MGIANITNSISNIMMKMSSSILPSSAKASNFLGAWGTVTLAGIDLVNNIVNFIAKLFYFVCKWMLYVVDIIFFYVQQLAGLNMKFDSLEGLLSEDSDFVFNLLFSNSATINIIIRNLIVIAIVLIIIFAIIAVIKNQFDAVKSGKVSPNGKVIKSMVKAFALLILTPLIAIVGIIASNLILQTLYRATNTGGSASLSSQIFLASSSSANSYRTYAKNGKRIPITYDFTHEEEIYKYYSKVGIDEEFVKYLTAPNNAIYATYLMFNTTNFITYESINDVADNNENKVDKSAGYYSIYDMKSNNMKFGDDSKNSIQKRIESYAVEYYVMADVVEYAISSTNSLYFMTLEDVLQSVADMYNFVAKDDYAARNAIRRIFDSILGKYTVQFIESAESENIIDVSTNPDLYSNMIDVFNGEDWLILRYVSTFIDTDTDNVMSIEYNHFRGEHDEIEGAKYIMAVENSTVINGVTFSYFEPLSSDYSGRSVFPFESEYHITGVVPAKGIFEDSKYPTAIKQNKYGQIEFYRYNLTVAAIGSTANVASIDWSVNNGNFISNIITSIRLLFDPTSLIPRLTIDDSFSNSIRQTYEANNHTVKALDGGRMHIGYMFPDGLTSLVMKNPNNMSISNFYSVYNLNFLLLVMGTILILKTVFSAIFALIQRAYDLFLIIMLYPTACATIPLDSVGISGGYKNWVDNYYKKLFSTYGLILGLNFVLMLFPIIQSISFFKPQNVAENKAIRSICVVLFGNGSNSTKYFTSMLNLYVSILFELVAFTFIKSVPQVISSIVGGDNLDGEGVLNNVKNTIKSAGKVMAWMLPVGKILGGTGKVIKFATDDKARAGLKDKLKSFLPGSAFASWWKDRKHLGKLKKEQDDALHDLKDAMDNGESKEEIEKKIKEFQKKQQAYTQALVDPHKSRIAADVKEKKKRKQDEENGVSSREDDDLKENNIDESLKSDKELEEDEKKSEKYIKRLQKKQKKGRLSKEEQKALDTYTDLRDAAQNERERRAIEKEEFEAEKKEVERLKKKGNLTAEELEKVRNFDVHRLEKQEELREKNNKEQKERLKKDRKEKKKEKKKEKRRQKDKRLFDKTGHKRGQKRRLKKLEKETDSIKKKINGAGFNVKLDDISKMDESRVNDMLKNPGKYGLDDSQKDLIEKFSNSGNAKERRKLSEELKATGFGVNVNDVSSLSESELAEVLGNSAKYGINSDQMRMMNQYSKSKKYIDSLVDLNNARYDKVARRKVHKKELKDKELAGYRGINIFKHIRKGIRNKRVNNVVKKKETLAEINKQLAGSSGQTSFKGYRKNRRLQRKKAGLEADIHRTENWSEINNPEYRRARKQEERENAQAAEYLRRNGIELTQENLDKALRAMRANQKKKNVNTGGSKAVSEKGHKKID